MTRTDSKTTMEATEAAIVQEVDCDLVQQQMAKKEVLEEAQAGVPAEVETSERKILASSPMIPAKDCPAGAEREERMVLASTEQHNDGTMELFEEMVVVMDLPSLSRQARVSTATPGAYSVHSHGVQGHGMQIQAIGHQEDGTIGTSGVDVEEERQVEVNNSGLAVANLVGGTVTQVATQVDSKATWRKYARAQRNKFFCLAMWLILVVGIVVALVVALQGKDESDTVVATTQAPTLSLEAATLSLEANLLTLLPDYTLDAMEEVNSPQSLAYTFLVEDPSLATYSDSRIRQRFALATFFHATGGMRWPNNTNWLSYSHHECTWYHQASYWIKDDELIYGDALYPSPCVHATTEEYFNTSYAVSNGGADVYNNLWLWRNNLKGTLPRELFWLTSLKSISLFQNSLTGSLPTDVGDLLSLEAFAVLANRMTGTMPSELGLLSNVKDLAFLRNEISGSIPTELGLLSRVEFFHLDSMRLTGTLPTELGGLASVDQVFLHKNLLTGTIPSEVGRLSTMRRFDVSNNALLTGTVPTELDQLSELWLLYLHTNSFEGSIRTQMGTMSALVHLSLQNNMFASTLPSELGKLSDMRRMRLHGNAFTGPIPTELGSLNALEILNLHDNMLTSTIPSELGNLTELLDLYLSDNEFSGSIPASLGILISEFKNLTRLNITQNAMLTGTLPGAFCSAEMEGLHFDCTSLLCGCNCTCTIDDR